MIKKKPIRRQTVALDTSSPGHPQKKTTCPCCGHKKRFVRYWDSERHEYLPENFGKCDRLENCGYYEAPWNWLKENRPNTNKMETKKYIPAAKAQSLFKQPKEVDKAIVQKTLSAYDKNNLAIYLNSVLGEANTSRMLSDYFIGTAQGGGTIFWQIDSSMRTRTGQRIVYDATGHREKGVEPKRLFIVNDGYEPCIFGEHLLYTVGNKYPIAIVESEKTAAIASVYLPHIDGRRVLWMAASGVYGLTEEKSLILAGKEIILVPDFSFHARAIWGQVPMRKSTNELGRTVIDADGALQPDFVSVADRLRNLGCIVKFFDANPNAWDSSDIADLLLLSAPPVHLKEPDYLSLRLESSNKSQQSHTEYANPSENEKAIQTHANVEEGFRIAYNSEGRSEITVANPKLHEYLTNLFNNTGVKVLAQALGAVTGTIDGEDKTPWTTTEGQKERLAEKYKRDPERYSWLK